jgi:ABC-2 type transport system ATP-binding protein
MNIPIVKVEHLSHRYSTAWAISDINFELNKKGVYGLLGSNGAGKSTTMNILSGVLNQTKGEVLINGINLKVDPIEAKKNIGFLPQIAPLYLDLSVREYLVYAARLRSVPSTILKQSTDKVLEQCSLTHMQNRLLKNLSGGYKQRVGIAQSIIHSPALVVLDEPSNGLDPVQIVEIRNLITQIGQDHTVLISSHILSEIQILCQEILMIEQGKLVFADSIDSFSNYIAPTSMYVEFENAPISDQLMDIRGISRIEKLNARTFRVFYDGNKAIPEAIIVHSVKSGWRMTQLTIEKRSIDEIFKQLTKQVGNN